MTNTQDIKKQINEIYQADIDAIRNLSVIAGKLQSGGKNGVLTIPGNVNIEGTLVVNKDTTFKSNQIVSGSQTISGTQNVSGNSNISGNHTINKKSIVKGGQTVSGVQTISGSQTITGSHNVSGNSTINGSQTVNKTSLIKGIQTIETNQIIKGIQTVNGVSTFQEGIKYGDNIFILLAYDYGSIIGSCSRGCESGLLLQTYFLNSSYLNEYQNVCQWKIISTTGKTGPVKYGDKFKLKLLNGGNLLGSCGSSHWCSDNARGGVVGYKSTSSPSSSKTTWSFKKLNGKGDYVTTDDTLEIIMPENSNNKLRTCNRSSCGSGAQYGVDLTYSSRTNANTKWKIKKTITY